MSQSKFHYVLPSDAPSSVLLEEGTEHGLVGSTTGSGKTLPPLNASTRLKVKDHKNEITLRWEGMGIQPS